MDSLKLKRAYDPPSRSDGRRVLVDRLWPRGLTKAKAGFAEWAKAVAPSNELRKRFHGGQGDWAEFRKLYLAELRDNKAATDELVGRLADGEVVTLLYASRSEDCNHALVLAEYLKRRVAGARRAR